MCIRSAADMQRWYPMKNISKKRLVLGGLCTGVSTLAKLLNPKIKVIAVEPTGAACLKASLEAGEVTTISKINTIAVYYRENSRMVRPDLNATAEARVKGLVGQRSADA